MEEQLVDEKDNSLIYEFVIPKTKVSYNKDAEPTVTVTSGEVANYSGENVTNHTLEPAVPGAAVSAEHTHGITATESIPNKSIITSARVSLSEQAPDNFYENSVQNVSDNSDGQPSAATDRQSMSGPEATSTFYPSEMVDLGEIIKGCYSISDAIDRHRVAAMKKNISKGLFIKRQPKREARSLRILQEREASLGSNVFAADKENGIEHQFHYLERSMDGAPEWMWHMYWRDQSGKEQVLTTRYEIQSNKIIKIQDGQVHRAVDLREARTLYDAICRYWKFVKADLYL